MFCSDKVAQFTHTNATHEQVPLFVKVSIEKATGHHEITIMVY